MVPTIPPLPAHTRRASHQEVASFLLSLNLGWPCHLLYPGRFYRNSAMDVRHKREATLDPPVPVKILPLHTAWKREELASQSPVQITPSWACGCYFKSVHFRRFCCQQIIPETRTGASLHLCLRSLPAWSLLRIRTAWEQVLSASLSPRSWQTLLVGITLVPIQSRYCLEPYHWALCNNCWAMDVGLCAETICHSGITHPVSRASVHKDKGSGAP